MKILWTILIVSILATTLKAQQVTSVDCCVDVGSKAMIAVNDNTANNNSLVAPAKPVPVDNNGKCDFKLAVSSNTSAGVYNSSDNLIRTLWNGVRYDAGCYSLQWDGLLDDGTQAPVGTYNIKILTNNVTYEWEGVIGNTSTDFTGDFIHKGENLEDIAFPGNGKAFYANGYSEHSSGQKMFLLSDIQRLANARYEQTTQCSYKVATDGNYLYWFGYNQNDGEGASTFIFKANPSDNTNPYATMPAFSQGQAVTFTNSGVGTVSYGSVAGLVRNNWDARPTGIDVQKSGNYIFLARAGISQLQVINKNTGVTAYTYNFLHVYGVACDDSNNLWLTVDNVLHKYTVGSDGSLTNQNITYTGLNKATCLGISPDYSTISVGDNGTFQVKSYSTSTNNLVWTLGQAGGYSANPYAANDKFFFIHFVKYAPDGSIWIGDKENFRTQIFNSDRTYKTFIGFLPTSRACMADQNNPTRVFSNFVEFQRDYSKTLDNGFNGSWKLKANWQYGIDDLMQTTSFQVESKLDNYSGFYNVQTLSNGRTYGKIFKKDDGTGAEVELTTTGLRYTGADGQKAIGRDGTLFFNTNGNANNNTLIYKQRLTGFDASGNPVRENPILFASTPNNSNALFPFDPGNGYEVNTGHTSSSDRYIFFSRWSPPDKRNQGVDPDAVLGYHLGAVRAGDNKYLWKTSKSTFTDYYGAYPTNGDFDIGNGWPQQHSDTKAMVYNNDIFWNANGEFWRGGEINIWNHFNDNGLLVGHFGVSNLKNNNGAYAMAGNALNAAVVKPDGNNYYIYHCDESVHAGIHSWHVKNLNTIMEQDLSITLNNNVLLVRDTTSLMNGLPFKSNFTGGNGWTIDYGTALYMHTNNLQYIKDSTDLFISGNGKQVIKRTLNNSLSLDSWLLSGGITMQNSEPTISMDNYNYLEVLDIAGKIIARFQAYSNTRDSYHTYFIINSEPSIADGLGDFYNSGIRSKFMNFSFNYVKNILTFKIGDYKPVVINNTVDVGANKSIPAYLRVNQYSNGNQNHAMGLYKLKFKIN